MDIIWKRKKAFLRRRRTLKICRKNLKSNRNSLAFSALGDKRIILIKYHLTNNNQIRALPINIIFKNLFSIEIRERNALDIIRYKGEEDLMVYPLWSSFQILLSHILGYSIIFQIKSREQVILTDSWYPLPQINHTHTHHKKPFQVKRRESWGSPKPWGAQYTAAIASTPPCMIR